MNRTLSVFLYIQALMLALLANSFLFLYSRVDLILPVVLIFVVLNIIPGLFFPRIRSLRLKISNHGAVTLCVFLFSAALSILYHIILAFILLPDGDYWPFIYSALVCICAEAVIFWNGIISVYLMSYQLGIKHRILSAICGIIPILNLIVLRRIIKVVFKEVDDEITKENMNAQRAELQLCKTKYPLLLVHGVFFRDSKHFNYWGRIPQELKLNGATIYYGNHQSAASIADCGTELAARIREIVETTGCEKLNIVAHSKGGLDCRYAIANSDISQYVASLTTINTPHRGCTFADYLLNTIPTEIKNDIATKYNAVLRKLGDHNPDFLAAVNDLTASFCVDFDAKTPQPENIYCQSVGSITNNAAGGKFPLNLSYYLASHFDGKNDGLVSEESFKWSENYQLLVPSGSRGISHGDMIDLNRENFDGFDVREFYVQLINDLKERGL